jgi:hypothetical protein
MLPIYFTQVLIVAMLLAGAWKYGKLNHAATYLALGVNLFVFFLEPVGRSEKLELLLTTVIKG